MRWLVQVMAIGGAGFAGAVIRFVISALGVRLFGAAFPIATMAINVSGCFLLSWFLTSARERWVIGDTTRLAIATGFVGAYTTFSTYLYETNTLADNGAGIKAAVNLIGSIVLGLAAVRLGVWMGLRH